MVLLLPLVTAWRLGIELASELDEVIAAELIVNSVGLWAVGCGLLLGSAGELFVPAALRSDSDAVLSAVSRRMLAVLLIVPASLALVHPIDLASPGPYWRDLGLLMATVAVPGWTGTLLARMRGLGPLAAVGLVVPWGAAVFGGTWALCQIAYLDAAAVATPVAAAGVVGSIGLYLAVTERVTASLGRVFVAVGCLASGLGAALMLWLAHPDLAMAWITQPLRVHATDGEILVFAAEPNLRLRILSIGADGVERLPHGVVEVEYVDGQRIEARPTARLPFPARTVRMCAVGPAGERCVGARYPADGVHIDVHGEAPLVLMVTRHAILAWNVRTDAAWQVLRPDDEVRWPCFDDGGGLMWRLRSQEGPYSQERLVLADLPPGDRSDPPDVSAHVADLALGHPHQCREPQTTVGRLVRGRKLVGRPHTLLGPGLPPEGADLGPEMEKAFWSADGQTFMYAIDPAHVRFYRPETGLSDVLEIKWMKAPTLSPDGRLLAHAAGRLRDGGVRLVVRRVPDGAVVASTVTESDRTLWVGNAALLRIVEGRLLRFDVVTGEDTTLFPAQDGP